MNISKYKVLVPIVVLLSLPTFILASESVAGGVAQHAPISLLWIALILIAAKISSLVEKIGQPTVLGELLIGVVLGNLGLLGFHMIDAIKTDSVISFFSELGVIILLFQIGLESNIGAMKKVGKNAFLVAIAGVVVPILLGTYIIGPLLLPGLSSNAYLFLGATLTATSVGITARVFKDLKKLASREAQTVLGAAVIDDVLGLIILAVVSSLVTVGALSFGGVGIIVAKAVGFLAGSIILGQILAHPIGKFFSKIHTGVAMKFTIAISFGLIFAYLASVIGLAPIIGSFAAGLVLDAVHFRFFQDPEIVADLRETIRGTSDKFKKKISTVIEHHAQRHIEDLIDPLGHFFVPIFFVFTGMNVRLETLFNPQIILVAIGITIAAIVGKMVAGIFAGRASKLIVGVGMVPRGEVGLIFATIGKNLGVVSEDLFSVIIIMVITTTLLTPSVLAVLLKKS